VLELEPREYAARSIYGDQQSLDGLAAATELSVRIASDELLLIGDRDELHSLSRDQVLFSIDLTAAYCYWAIGGDDRYEIHARLSETKLPRSGVVVGSFADAPAKVFVRTGELLIVVSSVLGRHVQRRILAASAGISTSEADAVKRQVYVA
jgi:hypothetical protein